MDTLTNIDLLIVGVSIASTLVLGFSVYLNNPSSVTNRTFLYFTLITAIWGAINYFSYRLSDPTIVLWAMRAVLFFAVWHTFTLFRLLYVFPRDTVQFPTWYWRILVPYTIFVSLITLTPLTIAGFSASYTGFGTFVPTPIKGIGMGLFGLTSIALVCSGIFILIQKMRQVEGIERRQHNMILLGSILMFGLIILFNFVLPVFANNVNFIPFGALFTFPFVLLTSYTIYHDKLFNLKVAATALLGFFVTAFSFVNVLYSNSTGAILVNVSALAISLFGTIQIIRTMIDLEEINVKQESLLYFVSHEVKVYLTKSMYAFASIKEGDFGPVSDSLSEMSTEALGEMRDGLTTVLDILGAASLKRGIITYTMRPFDLKKSVLSVVDQLKAPADKKKLVLDVVISQDADFTMVGDDEKITQHVLRNLLDNAIKYTPSGTIHVDLVRTLTSIRFSIKDSGVGIGRDDMKHLFTEGGKGKESTKVNVHSTGYGLFVAKMVTDAHGAKIWAESQGIGKGSRFVVEFPLK